MERRVGHWQRRVPLAPQGNVELPLHFGSLCPTYKIIAHKPRCYSDLANTCVVANCYLTKSHADCHGTAASHRFGTSLHIGEIRKLGT